MPWILLFAAIATEIVATVFLKASDGMSKLWPSVIVVAGYLASFGLLAKALKDLEVGVAYAIWSGVGTAAVAVLGVWFFDESASLAKALWIGVIVVGVIGLQVSTGGSQ
ncbi:DMT family transporter [Angustibacter sp. McL0619]|uniref:DMT family transporter n=1 Tax=Angustibacter sp. McL0619 TaxID=3415676 RepID=UPI003CEE820B